MSHARSLQDQYSPDGICYGCGPKNPKGLHVQSFVQGDIVVATWMPKPEYQAFPNVLCGGVIGSLLDCHSNWAAAWYLMQASGAQTAPLTVTAEFTIKLRRPTPIDEPVQLSARLVSLNSPRATIHADLISHDKVCATCTGIFVAVRDDHPAHGVGAHS